MTVLALVVTGVALVVGYGWHHYTKKNDSALEQMAEIFIEEESGIVLDFSAADKEKEAQESK